MIYQYAERLRSELMIAHKVIEKLRCLKGDELEGGIKIVLSFFDALTVEAQLVQKALRSRGVVYLETKMREGRGSVKIRRFEESIRSVAEATSLVSTISDEVVTFLREKGLF